MCPEAPKIEVDVVVRAEAEDVVLDVRTVARSTQGTDVSPLGVGACRGLKHLTADLTTIGISLRRIGHELSSSFPSGEGGDVVTSSNVLDPFLAQGQ